MRRPKPPAPEESGNFFQVWGELLKYSKKYTFGQNISFNA